jgi:hypothetical protein
MARKEKRRNQPGIKGTPRGGEKSKQTKRDKAKETKQKGAKQTKLDFTATGTPENTKKPSENEQWMPVQQTKLNYALALTGTPTNTSVLKTPAITPEVTVETNAENSRLPHPTPPTTPDRMQTTPKKKTSRPTNKRKPHIAKTRIKNQPQRNESQSSPRKIQPNFHPHKGNVQHPHQI